jgi:hypothetical protein
MNSYIYIYTFLLPLLIATAIGLLFVTCYLNEKAAGAAATCDALQ